MCVLEYHMCAIIVYDRRTVSLSCVRVFYIILAFCLESCFFLPLLQQSLKSRLPCGLFSAELHAIPFLSASWKDLEFVLDGGTL